MLAKCANPTCSALFRYLHQGRLFVLDRLKDAGAGERFKNERRAAHQLRYFWLCDTCHRSMTVVTEQGWKVKVVPFAALQCEQTSWKASAKLLGAGPGTLEEVQRKPAA